MKLKANLFLLIFILTGIIAQAQSQDKLELFFKLSDYFLKRHVYKGLVNYQYSSKNSAEIELLHKTIQEVDLSAASDVEKKAFYVNAYNILVIYQVTQSYPLARPLDKEGFFDASYHDVAGERLTLNELETNKMLDVYNDPRFHFVLACAAISCPKLYNLAYQPQNVDELLEERTTLALNDDAFIVVDDATRTVKISQIFEWYKADFEKSGTSTLDFINQYRTSKIPTNYTIEFYQYDWKLNERT